MKYLKHFPKPLLDDLVADKWLPVVGAGLSMNASVPAGRSMPLWGDLGEALAGEIADYPYAGALDAISAYSHEFSRPKLIERLGELLLVGKARPGEAHRAFATIPFDVVCTTNFDFLLERQYGATPRHYHPIIDEEQLSVNLGVTGVTLLKLHGDLNHPKRLVVTEEDYDAFIGRYPLLATYLANLLITRTAVFVGYSLDDPDFRQIWQVIGDRLGKSRRLAYALLVDPRQTDIARFDRRGVKVIALPGSKKNYGAILAAAFGELGEYVRANLIQASQVKDEDPLQELSLPPGAMSRLCFFAIPLRAIPFYRDRVFPIVESCGFVPITADSVVSPGENYVAKIDVIIDRSSLVVADITAPNALVELGVALGRGRTRRVLIIAEDPEFLPLDLRGQQVLIRPPSPYLESDYFLEQLGGWFRDAQVELTPELRSEPLRLLELREYRAAVISAITLLENALSVRLGDAAQPLRGLRRLLEQAASEELLPADEVPQIHSWIRTRNVVVHGDSPVTKGEATEIVRGVGQLIQALDE